MASDSPQERAPFKLLCNDPVLVIVWLLCQRDLVQQTHSSLTKD